MTCGPAAFGHGWFPYPICLDFNIPLRHESPRQGSVRPGGELFKLSSKPMSGQLGECSSMQVMGLCTQLTCIQFEPHWSHDLANATLGRPLQGVSIPVRGIYSKSRSFNSNIATSSDRQVPFGGLRHCCKQHRRSTLRRLFSKVASLLHWQPYKSLPGSHDTRGIGKAGDKPPVSFYLITVIR